MSDAAACSFCGRAVDGPAAFCEACDSAVDIDKVLAVLPAPPPRTALPPREIGRFRVVRPVGEGGSGVVYEALDPMLGRSVALKLLKPMGLSVDVLARFFREARVLARFRHPHVVQIFELGRHAGRDYLAMEFVEGKRFPATSDRREAVRRLAVIARALGHVHAKGIVHRDIKPSNILVETGGRPVLMDFGIARSGGISSTLSAEGMILGTPGYMAPEQLAGELDQIGAPADIYALGVLLYEILAGRRPYDGRTVVELARRIREGRPAPPRSLRPDVPADLEVVCLKALAVKPEERYPTAYALADELDRWLAGKPLETRARRRRPVPWLLAGAAALLLSPLAFLLSPPASVEEMEPGRAETAKAKALLGTRPSDPDARWEAHARAEAHLLEASALSPRLVDAPLELGRLYAERGRFDAAHEAWGRVLRLDPAHAGARAALAELVVTEQILLRVDRLLFPELTKSLQDRLAARAPSLDAFGAAVARGDWDVARRHVPASAVEALDFLSDRRRPLLAFLASRGEELPPGAPGLWRTLIRAHEGRARGLRPSFDPGLHAGALRLAAALDDQKAEALLDRALRSNPDYVQARLARYRLGRTSDLDDALRLARRLQLNDLALKEIASLRP